MRKKIWMRESWREKIGDERVKCGGVLEGVVLLDIFDLVIRKTNIVYCEMKNYAQVCSWYEVYGYQLLFFSFLWCTKTAG